MKKLILLLFISISLNAQLVKTPQKKPTLVISDKDVGTLTQGTTHTDSIALNVLHRSVKIDSVTVTDGITILDTLTMLEFDGVDDYLSVSDDSSLDLNGDYSIEIDITFNQLTDARFLSKDLYHSSGYRFGLKSDGTLIFSTNQASATQSTKTSDTLTAGIDYLLKVEVVSGTAHIYINGVEASYSESGAHLDPLANSLDLFIGRYASSSSNFLNGEIRSLKITNTTDVVDLFDDISSTTWTDQSTNGNDATIYGATLKGYFDPTTVIYGDTTFVRFELDISEEGNFDGVASIYNTSSDTANIGNITWSVINTGGSISTPTLLAITDSTHSETGIVLDWIDNSESDFLNYVVQRSTDDITYNTIAYPSNSEYTDNNIIEAVRYYYKVKAVNLSGTSSSYTSSVNAKSLTSGTAVYIASDYSGTENGTYTEPYNSINDVDFSSISAGTNVYLKGGLTYTRLEVYDIDGTENNRVLITNYASTSRAKVKNSWDAATSWVIAATDDNDIHASYLTFKNLEIEGKRWAKVDKTDYLVFDNCYFHYKENTDEYITPDGAPPFYARYGGTLYMTIKNCIFEGGFTTRETGNVDDMISFDHSSKFLVEDSFIKNIYHVLIAVNNSSDGVIRRNRFYNQYHHAMNVQGGAHDILIENNYYEKVGTGIRNLWAVPSSAYRSYGFTYLNGYNLIFRNNLLQKGGATADESDYNDGNPDNNNGYFTPQLQMTAEAQSPEVYNNRVYNNTLYNGYGIGFQMRWREGGLSLENNKFFNNALVGHGDPSADNQSGYASITGGVSDSVQIYINSNGSSIPSNNDFNHNYFSSVNDNIAHDDYNYYVTANYYSDSKYSFTNNVVGGLDVFNTPTDSIDTPIWLPTESQDYTSDLWEDFNPKTVLQDAGRHLTAVTSNSTDNIFSVADARVFFDGFDWLEADSIVITNNNTRTHTRITDIDYSTNILTVADNVTVSSGDYVDVINSVLGEYRGDGIDIGVFEENTFTLPEPTLPEILASTGTSMNFDSVKFAVTFNSNYANTNVVFQYSTVDPLDVDDAEENSPIPSTVLASGISSTVYIIIPNLTGSDEIYYKWTITNSEGSDETSTVFEHNYIQETATWGANLLASYNYGFESGNTTSWGNVEAPTSFAVSTTQIDSGSYSGKVTATRNNGIITQGFTFTAGETYRIDYSIYIDSGSVMAYDPQDNLSEFNTEYSTTGEWIYGSHEIVSSGGYDQIGFISRSYPSTFYIDNVRIRIKQ